MIIERAMPLGGSVTIDGVAVEGELALTSISLGAKKFVDLTYSTPFSRMWMIKKDDIIYTFSYYSSSYYFFQFDGKELTQLPDPPAHSSYMPEYLLYNGEIHMMFGNSHYKYDGEAWVKLGLIVSTSNNTVAIVYNNEIHWFHAYNNAMGGKGKHYKWDGTAWTQVSNMPFRNEDYDNKICAFVYNGVLHLGGEGQYQYSFVDGKWVQDDAYMVSSRYNIVTYERDGKLYSSFLGGNMYEFDGEALTLKAISIDGTSCYIYSFFEYENEFCVFGKLSASSTYEWNCSIVDKKAYYTGLY